MEVGEASYFTRNSISMPETRLYAVSRYVSPLSHFVLRYEALQVNGIVNSIKLLGEQVLRYSRDGETSITPLEIADFNTDRRDFISSHFQHS